jgi:polyferredoxin
MAGWMLFQSGLAGLFQRITQRKEGPPWSEMLVLIIVAYIIAIPWIGFLLTTALFMFATMFYLKPKSASLPRILFWAVLITVLLWLTFGFLLRVPLPAGKLWS